jgi:pimeloyl-ACP methyl ester carboxylesterase
MVRAAILVLLFVSSARATWLLHLPGIAGSQRLDAGFVSALKQAGVTDAVEIYDWTDGRPGLASLFAYDGNRRQARVVARQLARYRANHPAEPIILTCHSGGAGIAVWALEALPEGVRIDTLVMVAPALSPGYDLSKALSHVRGRAIVFSSTYDDLILGWGTTIFGTIDRLHVSAAGRFGFVRPGVADAGQYAKLVPVPYDAAWLLLGNLGDHIGPMFRPFAREVIAPMLKAAATQPAR